jgi:cobalamin synthase
VWAVTVAAVSIYSSRRAAACISRTVGFAAAQKLDAAVPDTAVAVTTVVALSASIAITITISVTIVVPGMILSLCRHGGITGDDHGLVVSLGY